MADSKSGRKKVALLLVGMVLGAALITPAGAHVTSVAHSWKKHFLPLAKKAFYTKKQSNKTFYAAGSKVANSDKVDGLDAAQLIRLAGGGGNCPSAIVTTTDQVCGTLTITAPTAGLVKVDGGLSYYSSDCTSACDLFMYLTRQGGVSGLGHYESLDLAAGTSYGSIAEGTVFAVPAGTNVFEVHSYRNSGNGTISTLGSSLTATFSPFGGTGAASTSSTSSGNGFGR